MRLLPLSVLAGLFIAIAFPASAGMEDDDWHEVRSDNFRIFTNGDPADIEELAREMEYFRGGVLALTQATAADSLIPFKIFVARSRGDFKDIFSQSWVMGAFSSSLRGNYAIVDLSQRVPDHRGKQVPAASFILKHEYIHFLLRNRSTVKYPYWYDEGLAEYLSTLSYEDGTINVGFPVAYRHYALSDTRLASIENLLRSTRADRTIDTNRLYAQGWMLVHHLHQDPELAEKLVPYLTLYDQTGDSLAAFNETYGLDLGKLRRTLERTRRKGKYSYSVRILNEPLAVPRVTVLAMEPDDARLELAQVIRTFQGNKALDEVRELVNAVLIRSPANPVAVARYVDLMLHDGNLEAAGLALSRVEGDTESTALLIARGDYGFAKLLREAATYRDLPQEPLWEARRHYLEALKRDPNSAEAFFSYGLTFLGSEAPEEEREPRVAFEQAWLLLPNEWPLRRYQALAYFQSGAFAEGCALAEEINFWDPPGKDDDDAEDGDRIDYLDRLCASKSTSIAADAAFQHVRRHYHAVGVASPHGPGN